MMRLIILVTFVLLTVFLAPVTSADESPNLPPPDPAIIDDIYQRINSYRERYNRAPLQRNSALMQAAQDQAEWLVITGIRTHFRPDGSRPSNRAEAAGYQDYEWCCGENYYMSIDATPDLVWNFWIWSAPHRHNLLERSFDHVGLGWSTDGRRISYVLVFGDAPDPNAPPPAPAESAPVVQAVEGEYIVQSGDTLASIAEQFNTSVEALVALNHLNDPGMIVTGQRLLVSGAIPANETVESAAETAQPVAAAPPPEPEYVNGQLVHVVQPEENLYRIAMDYGANWETLAEVNGLEDPRMLSVGQQIIIVRATAETGTVQEIAASAAPEENQVEVVQQPQVVDGQRVHVVQPEENLYRIALAYGTTWEVLAELNGLEDPRAISVGQQLILPSS